VSEVEELVGEAGSDEGKHGQSNQRRSWWLDLGEGRWYLE